MSVVDTVKGAIPTVKLPEIKLPEIKIPEIKLPDLETPIAAAKPAHALIGAGDAAVAKVKAELPGLPATIQARLTELSTKAQAQAKAQADAFPAFVKGLPALVKSTVETKVTKPLSLRQDKAEGVYDDLADRGHKVVLSLTKKPAPAAKPAPAKPAAKKAPAKKAV